MRWELVVQFDAFISWAEANLTPRVWTIRDDVRERVQRSDDLVRNSRELLRRHRDAEHRLRAFDEPYVPRLSKGPNDKLLAAVNYHRERTIDVLPSAYHRACRTWFYHLSLVDRITATLASRVYLDGNAATAERIAAWLPPAPGFPFPPAADAPASASWRSRRSGYWKRGRRSDG